jgi:multidrug efflux pump subunit AcrB
MNRAFVAILTIGALGLGCGGLLPWPGQDGGPVGTTVTFTDPGLEPSAAERLIAVPVELALQGVQGVASVESLSLEGGAVVTAWHAEDVRDHDLLPARIMDRTLLVQEQLPESTDPGWLLTAGSQQREMERLAIRGDEGWQACAQNMARELQMLRGVEMVRLVEPQSQRLTLRADPARLAATGLTLVDVQGALALGELNARAGMLDTEITHHISVAAPPLSPEQLLETLVATHGGVPLRLGDLATMELERDPDAPRAVLDGQPAALLSVVRAEEFRGHSLDSSIEETLQRSLGRCPAELFTERLDPGEAVLAVELALPPDSGEPAGMAKAIVAAAAPLQPEASLVELGRRPVPLATAPQPERLRLILRLPDPAGPEDLELLMMGLQGIPGLGVLSWEGPGSRTSLLVQGQDRDALARVAQEIEEQLSQQGGPLALDGLPQPRPEILVEPEREALAAMGLNTTELTRALRAATSCLDAGEVKLEGASLPMVLCSGAGNASTLDSLMQVGIPTPTGEMVPLGAVATISFDQSPSSLLRVDALPALRLAITSSEPRSSTLRRQCLQIIQQLELPAGVTVELEG